jgi:hypothetical protein
MLLHGDFATHAYFAQGFFVFGNVIPDTSLLLGERS